MTPVLSFLFSFALAVAALPGLIRVLTRQRAEQVISEDVPESHKAKKGTPTLGGIAIVLAASAVSLYYAAVTPGSEDVVALTLLLLATSVLGFWDDFVILRHRKQVNLVTANGSAPGPQESHPTQVKSKTPGQKWTHKMAAQVVIAGVFVGYLFIHYPILTEIIIPGTNRTLALGFWWIPAAIIYLVLMSNAVNLSDGLDGLAGGLSVIAGIACAAAALAIHRIDLAVFILAVGGACLGFLWYNCHPAQIFMGNTSSIALGMSLGAIALMTRQELLLIVPFGVFLAEAISVLLQVGYFKLTGRGKRLFRKAPLHHHFEMLGWKETRVVIRFWIVGVLLALLGFLWMNGGFSG